MSNEKNIVETLEDKKKFINIGKILLIIIVFVGIIITLGIGIYNSDWFITQTMPIKEEKNVKLGNRITYSYINKYEDGKLKINARFFNLDAKLIEFLRGQGLNNEMLVTFEFLDKDKFKITEIQFPMSDFIANSDDKTTYSVYGVLPINKNTVRKIKYIDPLYKEAIDMTYKEITKKLEQMYKDYYNNYFW